MRILMVLAVVMVTGCSDGKGMLTADQVCAERAEAWCSIVDQCDGWSWPNCIQEQTDKCIASQEPVLQCEQDACLVALWSTELNDGCEVVAGSWSPPECE